MALLATHAEYDVEHPLRSKVILAGVGPHESERTLTLEECLSGQIDGITAPVADGSSQPNALCTLTGMLLLVLSACETLVFDTKRSANEVLGIANGFIQAGVAGVIASLWPVDDQATFLLMSRFIDCYLDPQHRWTAAQALAEAQRWLREDVTNALLRDYPNASGLRFSLATATMKVNVKTGPPDERPFAHPFYWAAFTLTGASEQARFDQAATRP